MVVAIGMTACGKRQQAVPAVAADAAAVVAVLDALAVDENDAAVQVAGPAAWKDRPEPALRALAAALEQLSTDEARDWLEKRKLPRPEDVPPEEPPPSVRAAVDALVAWDGSGAMAPQPCVKGMGNAIPFRALMTAKAAFELSNGPADAPAHAALRMGVALRADDNDPMPMLVGAAMPKEAVESFTRRGITASVPATFALAPDLPWKVLASNARCVAWTLDTVDLASPDNADLVDGFKKMGRDPARALAEETAAVKAFWADTMKQAAAVKTRAELSALLERRIDEARKMQPQSNLVPLLGAPYAAKTLLRDDDSE
jgi:hypothetical protein